MVYVLIALALFGFLTLTLSNQNDQTDGEGIRDEETMLYVNELLSYVGSAQQAADMMISTGTAPNNLDLVLPTAAAFNTAPHIHKLFHPQGGGLNYQEKFSENLQNGATSQWAVNNNINVEWTPSTNNDVILTAYFITQEACAAINQIITGSATIPATDSPHAEYFLSTGTTALNTAECAACDGYPALCVENDTTDNYSFYNIIVAD